MMRCSEQTLSIKFGKSGSDGTFVVIVGIVNRKHQASIILFSYSNPCACQIVCIFLRIWSGKGCTVPLGLPFTARVEIIFKWYVLCFSFLIFRRLTAQYTTARWVQFTADKYSCCLLLGLDWSGRLRKCVVRAFVLRSWTSGRFATNFEFKARG